MALAEFEVDDAEPFMTGCDQRRDLDIAYIAGKLGVQSEGPVPQDYSHSIRPYALYRS